MPATAEAVPTKIIAPRSGWLSVDWAELWHYRELLYFLTWRDIKVRYKQTVLGILWAFIRPFVRLVIFSVIFGQLAKIDSEGYPYPVFLYAGLLPWQFFSEALSRSSMSVVGSANLVTKIYFPRLIIPFSSVGAGLVDFAISFTILFALMLYYGVAPTVQILAVLPLVLLNILAALGMGILLSSLSVSYRDFRHILPFLIQTWIYLTPVVYPVTLLPERWRWLLILNPMTGVVDAWRAAVLGRPFEWNSLGVSIVLIGAFFVFGLYYFRKTESRFADIV